MVQEVRKIILTAEEMAAAFDSYRRVTPHFLPDGNIVRCAQAPDHAVTVVIEAPAPAGGAAPAQFTFKGVNILRPLIRFCIENNIMLPRDGHKSVIVDDKGFTLCIELNMQIDLTESCAPMSVADVKGIVEILPQNKQPK